MEIKVDFNFEELKNHLWNGAEDTLATIEKYHLQDEFMQYLEECFLDCEPTDTQINDFIRFDVTEEWILDYLSLDDIDDIDDLRTIAKDVYNTEIETTLTDIILADKERELLEYLGGGSMREVFEVIEAFEY